MLTLKTTIQFRKDYKTAKKRGYNMDLLETAEKIGIMWLIPKHAEKPGTTGIKR